MSKIDLWLPCDVAPGDYNDEVRVTFAPDRRYPLQLRSYFVPRTRVETLPDGTSFIRITAHFGEETI